nr:putative RNA-dependent RNA polymerase [Rhizoctonia solani mitovirus 111]
MKTRYSIFKKFGRLPLNLQKSFNAMLSVKRRPLLMTLFLRLTAFCKVQLRRSKVAGLYLMISRILFLYRTMGPKGLTLYLKTVGVFLQQYLGDHKLVDPGKVSKMRPSRNNRGLPRIIPIQLRRAIRENHFNTIKWILTVINLFREIDYVGAPKLSTITDPNSGTMAVLPDLLALIPAFLRALGHRTISSERWSAKAKLFIIWKAAPGMLKSTYEGVVDNVSNYSSNPVNLVLQLRALRMSEVWEDFSYVIKFTNNRYILRLVELFEKSGLINGPTKKIIGKLHAKEEAAGKVRLFAIVDAWTQWALYPLHAIIFEILKKIPQDGTFDQTAPLTLLNDKVKEGKVKSLYSLDLTAATDRLPVALQVHIVNNLVGDISFGYHWASLLVGRTYKFYQMGYSDYAGDYRYAVGQPMGALSSWAMLALTHHFIVQCSAWLSKTVPVGTWYVNYALLGDDLVIGDSSVKDKYLSILKSLGMEVNVHKSILSETGRCLEFAKRTIYLGIDVSPIPLKEVASAQALLPALVQFGRKYGIGLAQLLYGFGYGWRTLSWLSKPLGKLPSSVRAIVLAIHMPSTAEEIKSFFQLGAPKFVKYINEERGILIKFLQTELRVAKLKLEAKLAFVKDFRFTFGPDKLPLLWEASLVDGEKSLLLNRIKDREVTLGFNALNTKQGKAQIAKIVSELKDLENRPRNETITEFFYEVYRYMLNPALANYMVTVQRILLKYPKWEDSFRFMFSQRGDIDFVSQYALYLEFLKDLSELGEHIFQFEKPEGSESESRSLNAVSPANIRFYRKWSGVLQGSVPLNELKLKTPKIQQQRFRSELPNQDSINNGPLSE